MTPTDGNNIVVGDNAEADFNANRLAIRVQTIDPSVGDDDTISTLTGNDIVLGGMANDTVATTGGNNIIVGDNGNAIFNNDAILQSVTSDEPTHGGMDLITSANGNDTVLGGSAADQIVIAGGDNLVTGDNAEADFNSDRRVIRLRTLAPSIGGDDVISTGIGHDIIFGGVLNDAVDTTGGNNIVVGDNGHIHFTANADVLNLTTESPENGGRDTIVTASGHDTILGGSSADQIDAANGNNIVVGDNAEADFNLSRAVIRLQTIDPSIGGNDSIRSLTGDDIIFGGVANDGITTTGGHNIIVGDNGNAQFNGNAVLQTVTTDAPQHGGNDAISSASGDDSILGGSGADRITISGGDNIVAGDNAEADFNSLRQVIRLQTIDPSIGGNDIIQTQLGDDIVFGGVLNDLIVSYGGNNILVGDNGHALFDNAAVLQRIATDEPTHGGEDTILSASGNDSLFGGSQDDRIESTGGNNVVLGDNGLADFNSA